MIKMLCCFSTLLPLFAVAQIEAKIDVAKPGHAVPKALYGIFYEDINYAGDGGLYPELIANRGFDWPTQNLEGWKKDFRGGAMARVTRQFGNPVHPNTAQYLRLETFGAGTGCGVRNEGFGGIAVQQGKSYDLSFYARGLEGYQGSVLVLLEDENNAELARYVVKNSELSIGPVSDKARVLPLPEWKRYTTVFKPTTTTAKAHLSVLMDQRGTVDIEFVSLFPQDTYAGRKNGLRKDLAEWLKGMKPGVMRFPGGCIIEGVDFANRYDWQRTVGSLESRPVNWNLWGYWQTHGLGYFEYFQLCEDIGAEPMPIVTAGLTCQFRKPEFLPMEALDVQVQEIIELIEFANGDVTTKWGSLRAEMGHPKPFNMKYVGIGNENWDKVFLDRYLAIQKVVKAKHPEIQIISSAGAGASGQQFDLAWKTLDVHNADLVDEHYYVPAAFLLNGANRYDSYDRKGPKVYVGEYACHLPNRANSLYSALCEAAMMTGFERNSDVVEMTSYAPLFNKIGNSQWVPDLIWFDNVSSFGTPNYYVQALFGNHLPSVILPTEYSLAKVTVEPTGRIGLNGWDTAMEFKDIQVKQEDKVLYAFDPAKGLDGWKATEGGAWSVKEGAIAQTKSDSRSVLSMGDMRWKDYTLTLKARKTAGAEGFIIRVRDNNEGFVHFNFGGWGNQDHGIGTATENALVRKPGKIIQNQWYDVKVSVEGERVSAWLDGEAIFANVSVPAQNVNSFFMVSGLDKNTREIVVKCVNVSESEQRLNLNLEGISILPQKAKRIQLAGDRDGVNTLEKPTHIAPVEDTVEVNSNKPVLTLAPMSLTIFRIKL